MLYLVEWVNWQDAVLRLSVVSMYVKLMLGRSDEAEEGEVGISEAVSGNQSGSGKWRKKRCEGRTCVMVWMKWEAGLLACFLVSQEDWSGVPIETKDKCS